MSMGAHGWLAGFGLNETFLSHPIYSSARVINVSLARVSLPPQQGFTTFLEVDRPIVINRILENLMSIITLDIEYLRPSTINVYHPGGGVHCTATTK